MIPALWVATEVLRGRWMGQPWGLLGYTQHGHLGLIQLAALTGVYGVSFLLALGSVALAEAIVRLCRGRGRALHSILAPAAVITACWAGGALFAHTSPAGGFGEHEVAIVQTNLEPAFHWTRSYTDAQVSTHLRATDGLSSTAHPALIVWPENSVPRYLETEPGLAAQLAGVAVRHRADLLFGGPRSDGRRIFNTARLITASGENGGYYDKQRLLLFAEEKRLILSSTPTPTRLCGRTEGRPLFPGVSDVTMWTSQVSVAPNNSSQDPVSCIEEHGSLLAGRTSAAGDNHAPIQFPAARNKNGTRRCKFLSRPSTEKVPATRSPNWRGLATGVNSANFAN